MPSRSHKLDECGTAVVIFALVIVALVSLVAIAVDLPVRMLSHNRLTTAADLAVLTGATMLKEGHDDATSKAVAAAILQANLQPYTGLFTLPALPAVDISDNEGVTTVSISETGMVEGFFDGIFATQNAAQGVAVLSAASFGRDTVDARPPLAVILAIENTYHMGGLYGDDSCAAHAIDCKYWNNCPNNCLQALDAAKETARQLIGELNENDMMSIISFKATPEVIQRLEKPRSDTGDFSLDSLNDAVDGIVSEAIGYPVVANGPATYDNLPGYKELFESILDELALAPFGSSEVVVILLGSGKHGYYKYPTAASLMPSACMRKWDQCYEEADRCLRSSESGERYLCYDTRYACLGNNANPNEEAASRLREELKHRFNGRVFSLSFVDNTVPALGPSRKERRLNLLIELSGDPLAPRLEPYGVNFACTDLPTAEEAGAYVDPGATADEFEAAADTIFGRYTKVGEPNGEIPRLISKGPARIR